MDIKYKFKRNADHQFMAFLVGKTSEGRGGIVTLFNIRVKVTDNGLCESVSLFERDKHFDVVNACLYDAISDGWLYPGELSQKDDMRPQGLFIRLTQKALDAVENGYMVVQGSGDHCLYALQENAQSILRDMPHGKGQLYIFGDQPK